MLDFILQSAIIIPGSTQMKDGFLLEPSFLIVSPKFINH